MSARAVARAALLVGLVGLAAGAVAQTPQPTPPRSGPMEQRLFVPKGGGRDADKPAHPDVFQSQQAANLRRRLIELDRLLTLGNLGRAAGLIDELAQHSGLERELLSRRIRLAQLQGDHALAVALGREAVAAAPDDPALWRGLGASLLAAGEPDSARVALDRFMVLNRNTRSAAIVGMDLMLENGYPGLAVGLIDSMRGVLSEPRFLGRQRALGLLALGRQKEAAAEVSDELRANPYNYALVRTELLEGPYRPADHGAFRAELMAKAGDPAARGGEALLVANLDLVAGRVDEALALVTPLTAQPALTMVLLQNCLTLSRELKLLTDPVQVQATVDFLLPVLENLARQPGSDLVIRRRAADYLAEVCGTALELDGLGDDPAAGAERFSRTLAIVREVNPGSEHLYSSRIRLADYTRDRLRDPAGAARQLEGMLLDLDLPTEGLALVRLTLGECYLAAGDTARGRTVLTRLGRDPEFREAGGHAHYHLARLDLAEGHFATARDRFAVIALDSPGAAYANDALELGLIIAEEMENPSGGPEILGLYAPAVYADLTAHPDARVTALERFLGEAERRLDLTAPQHLYERAAFELADAYAAHGRDDEALALLQRLALEHPDGRYAARALQRRGELLQEAGRAAAARTVWEQLLAQYPDYLFIDDVREELRALPQ
ncbi:tetratricopeptide repeat protein [bacterium]|nr:tetratricopeptide repeat protein [bacterium]